MSAADEAAFLMECMMHKTEVVIEAAKVAPAASVTVMSFLGYSVSDWTYLATLIYVLALTGHFVWTKWIRPWRRKRRMQGA